MKKLLLIAMVFLGSQAFAADYSFNVCKLQSHTDRDTAYIAPCGGWTSKNNCPSDGWLQWNMSSFQGQAMYSTAMAAMLSGKQVTVRLDGSSCAGYDTTTMIRINN